MILISVFESDKKITLLRLNKNFAILTVKKIGPSLRERTSIIRDRLLLLLCICWLLRYIILHVELQSVACFPKLWTDITVPSKIIHIFIGLFPNCKLNVHWLIITFPKCSPLTIFSVYINMALIKVNHTGKLQNHSPYHSPVLFIMVAPTPDCLCCGPCSVHNNLFLLLWSEDRRNAPYANPFPVTALDSQLHDSNA